MTWDEENRLMGINDNGRIHQYTYDAGGERVIKSSGDSQNVAINGQTAATIVHTDDYTGYVSPYFVISKGKFTKHYFEGAGRIVSKLGNGAFAQPLKITAGGVNYTKLTAEQQKALDNYVRTLGVPPGPPTQQGIYATPEFTGNPYPSEILQPVEENQEPPEGWPRNPIFNKPGGVPGPPVQFGPPIKPETVQAAEGFTGIGLRENDIFYFHPDHLGSTSYISTRNGSISQHVEYIAFGEILFEEHSSNFSSPYLFNGKELDRETNLSYYGARYLDMKTSLWLTVDPLALYNPIFEDEFYFDGQHNGGVFNPKNLNSYNYCYQNPINLIDPNGKQAYFIHGTSSSSKRWSETTSAKIAVKVILGVTNNKTYNASFNWDAPIYNGSEMRGKAASRLAKHVLKTRKEGESITLIGHSHGGNVAIQAAKLIYESTKEKVNIITIATPAYNKKGNIENPTTQQNYIKEHISFWNKIDGVSGGMAGDDTYKNNKTQNTEVDVSKHYKSNETLDAHSFDIEHPETLKAAIKHNNTKLKD